MESGSDTFAFASFAIRGQFGMFIFFTENSQTEVPNNIPFAGFLGRSESSVGLNLLKPTPPFNLLTKYESFQCFLRLRILSAFRLRFPARRCDSESPRWSVCDSPFTAPDSAVALGHALELVLLLDRVGIGGFLMGVISL